MARLLHLSDTHLVGPDGESEFPQIDAQARLATVLAAATAAGPFDAVVVTGDIADDGSGQAVRKVHELVEPMAPVTVAVPGNHDRADAVADVFAIQQVTVGTWQIIGAATNEVGEVAGHAGPVLDVLDSCDGPTAILMHHPLRSHSTHPWFTLSEANDLERRLLLHRAPLVLLSGHTHEAFDDAVGGVRLIGAPSTFYGIAHDGDRWQAHGAPTGARVVELNEDGTITTHLLLA